MSRSPMSITQICNNSEDEDDRLYQQQQQPGQNHTPSRHMEQTDPEVRMAAEALDSMAYRKTTKMPPIILPPISTMSAPSTTPSSPALVTPPPIGGSGQPSARHSFSSDSTLDDENRHTYTAPADSTSQPYFIRRVSNHPLVHSALRVYESSKASSPVVKYGAEMVESIASPIYGKFGRQPDHTPQNRYEDDLTIAATTALANTSLSDSPHPLETSHRRKQQLSRDDSLLSRSASRSTSPHRPYTLAAKSTTTIHHRHHHHHPNNTAVPSKSRWKQLVVHAGSAAGTTAAVISEESMKCLKYCLSWLQYATQHIEQQMHLLRNLLVSLATGPSKAVTTNNSNPAGTLAAIKKEVIETLRKVVDVISKYAGTGLPEQAKASVRAFILALPSRWALLNSTTSNTADTPISSPSLSPQLQETSIKLLNFGCESVEMLQSVSTVFSDTATRADLWLDRLHSVGVTRQSSTTTRRSSSGDVIMDSRIEQHGDTPMETN
ncbi:transcription factor Opi1-domain-containing protein [Chlamydoabsidia padenii]|nr:transcription factor Opi1-domain-containing protein [Chlamydoabsidia padenii]